MTTFLYSHKACLDHNTGPIHPEQPERLNRVLDVLSGASFSTLIHREAPRATLDQLSRVHDRIYIEQVLSSIPLSGIINLDPDTTISPGSGEAALRAAGAASSAVDAVMQERTKRAFCAVRPPGHHAEPNKAMGFCIFNNIAVAAAHARTKYGVEKVAIVDFDVHHGNGTQNMFSNEVGVLVTGSQQIPLFPGTGSSNEKSICNVVNMPLGPDSGSEEFQRQWKEQGLPRLAAFEPDLILIYAGFDGHRDDPLAQLNLLSADFAWLTNEVVKISEQSANCGIVSTLEGGYNLTALPEACAAHVSALM